MAMTNQTTNANDAMATCEECVVKDCTGCHGMNRVSDLSFDGFTPEHWDLVAPLIPDLEVFYENSAYEKSEDISDDVSYKKHLKFDVNHDSTVIEGYWRDQKPEYVLWYMFLKKNCVP